MIPESQKFEFLKGMELCMSPEQLQAHKFLISSEDLVPCPQGILLKRTACELRQQSFDHFQHHCAIWQPDEEPTSIKFIGCVEMKCQHYTPSRKRHINPGKTERYMSIVKAKSEANDQKLREKQAEQTKRQKEHAVKVAAMIEKRQAEKKAKKEARAARLEPMIAEAKQMHRYGKSFAMIAKKLGVGKTTVCRWFMTPEQLAQDRERWGQIRKTKGNADV